MARDIELRQATLEDVSMLAEMNQQLIIDQGSPNVMDFEALKHRMMQWLADGREAVIVEREHQVIGYLLYRRVEDEYYPYQDSFYIRQFFILPSFRRRGIGQIAFDQIVSEYFEPDVALMLDVLETNPEAKAFWSKMGFEEYHTTMRRSVSETAHR
ncbi:MAG: GNAT family N-acetyltransferase [Chloroflexota bacterium]